MRYFKIEYGTPYCGTDETEYLRFPDDYTNEDVYNYADELAFNHSALYGFDDDDGVEEEKYWYAADEIKETEIPEDCKWKDA